MINHSTYDYDRWSMTTIYRHGWLLERVAWAPLLQHNEVFT